MPKGIFKPHKAKEGYTISYTYKDGKRYDSNVTYSKKGAEFMLQKIKSSQKKGKHRELKNPRLKKVF